MFSNDGCFFFANPVLLRAKAVKGQPPGGELGLRTYGEVPLENLKSYPVPESIPENDTLSRSQIYLNNTLSFSCFRQNCALQGNLY